MTKYKYISTTLPYINSTPHIGHCFEFVLADFIAEYHRLKCEVFFNVGVDEHGQKVYEKATQKGYTTTKQYCDHLAAIWKDFCRKFKVNYDNFYRTTDKTHKENVLKFYEEIKDYIVTKDYEGEYCVGCESFIGSNDVINGRCVIHKTNTIPTKETNQFFDIKRFNNHIQDVLVDKTKSLELKNIIESGLDLSITRQNVQWGVETGDGDVFYVWFEALLNYIFSIQYYEDREQFNKYWGDSLIICGKDNLKFQAYILQAILLSNNIKQTSKILVHGNILDKNGNKLSKSEGNGINPEEQIDKYGVDAVRYYLIFGLNTFKDSSYSEEELVQKWNNDIVNGLGNLITRTLHLIDIRGVLPNEEALSLECSERIIKNTTKINSTIESYNLKEAGEVLNGIVSELNRRINSEKPFDKDCENYVQILNEIYFELKGIIGYYGLATKEHNLKLQKAFEDNKKIIIYEKIKLNA